MIKGKSDCAVQYIKNVFYYTSSTTGKLEFAFTVVWVWLKAHWRQCKGLRWFQRMLNEALYKDACFIFFSFLLTAVFAICPKWHLIHLNYQRRYNGYQIWQWLFWFCSSRNRERVSTNTWRKVLLMVIFCYIGLQSLLENNRALPRFQNHSRSINVRWELESQASDNSLSLQATELSAWCHGKSLPVIEWRSFNRLRRNSILGHIKYVGICIYQEKNPPWYKVLNW